MQNALANIQKALMQPVTKQAGKAQIKEKSQGDNERPVWQGQKRTLDRKNRERWEREGQTAPAKKHDMEL